MATPSPRVFPDGVARVEERPIASPPTIRRRFVFTVGANALRSLLSFTNSMLLARWFGPASFGTMAFLLGSFLAVRPLVDMGASTAFFTFMSQQPRSRRFIGAYYRWLGLQLLVGLSVVGILLPENWLNAIWRSEPRSLVVLALVASFMQDNVWAVLQQAAESQRQTLKVQGIGVATVGVHLLMVIVLWLTGWLRLPTVFGLIALEYGVAAICAHRFCIARFPRASAGEDLRGRGLFAQYLRYCLPLIPYSWLTCAYVFADRWLLQNYGGKVQQAFYSIGAQFSAVALLATSSILQVFWKEMAEAHHRGDRLRTRMLFERVSRTMLLVSAAVGCFFLPWAGDVLRVLLGGTYVAGAATLAIMLLYPIHQSLGLVSTTALYATERAATVVRVGTMFMLIGMSVTYLVLAPADALVPGLGLGSVGLALKMVGLQLIQMNLLTYLVARTFDWPFEWVHQPVGVLGCAALAWLAHAGALRLVGSLWPTLLVIAVAGLLYLLLITVFVFALPQLVGLTRAALVTEAMALPKHAAVVLRLK